jgi:uncharacterized protein YjbI with pentapeptide repeats
VSDRTDKTIVLRLCATAAIGLTVWLAAPSTALAGCRDNPKPGVDWSECRKRNVVLSGNDMSGANFYDIDPIGSDLRDSTLVDIRLEKAQLNRADFSRSKMTGANLTKAEAGRARFEQAELAGASFAKAELNRASFAGANLANSDLSKSELGRANFSGANLTNSRISFANLARAVFRGANVTGTDMANSYLYLTRFEGVDLSGTSGLQQGQIALACGNDETRLPDGLQAPANWPCPGDEE